VWQYITLMKRIYLIDCPGVVPPSNNDSEEDILLRGVVRVENVEHPEQYIAAVLNKTKPRHIERTYSLKGYNTATEFLELLARKGGRLLKGGEADVDGVAKMVLNDFLRGKIPWFTPPPAVEGVQETGVEGREGKLGEMGRKRKREDESGAEGLEAHLDENLLDAEEFEGSDGVDDEDSNADQGNESDVNEDVSVGGVATSNDEELVQGTGGKSELGGMADGRDNG
jgi:nuclear GTP-binding protein